ncbi:LysR substrate-binding domain-containing protein [Pseudoroseomonas wenyumeiae]
MEAAEAVAAQAQAEPNGIVRMSCPQGLIQNLVADILPTFMRAYPRVRVQMKVLNRRADLIEDGVDIALRARTLLEGDASQIVRPLGRTHLVFAISPLLRDRLGAELSIEHLTELPTLSMTEDADEDTWNVVGPADEARTIRHRPRLQCSNFDLLLAAATDGLGVALLPEHICRSAFVSGELVHVLPDWHTTHGTIYAVFASRKGLVPAVRALIDHLAVEVARRASPSPHRDPFQISRIAECWPRMGNHFDRCHE